MPSTPVRTTCTIPLHVHLTGVVERTPEGEFIEDMAVEDLQVHLSLPKRHLSLLSGVNTAEPGVLMFMENLLTVYSEEFSEALFAEAGDA